MARHPYEELYDDYQEEDAYVVDPEVVADPRYPNRNYQPRGSLRSVPLRKTKAKAARWQNDDDATGMFPEPRPRQAPAVRPTQAAQQASTRSHISHTALQVAQSGQHVGKSQLRYRDAQGREVWRQDNRQLVFEEVPPPRRRTRRRLSWLLWAGLGMMLMVSLVAGWNAAAAAIANHNLDAKYGYPRTWQTDAVVGHEDSPTHPSHFTCENLHGHILVTEYPGGDLSHARIYDAGGVFSDQLPVTVSFQDVNHNGKPDMLVQVGSDTPNTETIVFHNNGTQFVPLA